MQTVQTPRPANSPGRYHTVSPDRPNYAGKVIGGIVAVAILGAVGFYIYDASMSAPPPSKVTAAELPQTAPAGDQVR